MGNPTQTTKESTTIKGIGGQEQRTRDILQQLAESGLSQMGDLSGLASGQLQASPQDAALIAEIQKLTGEAGRAQIGDNASMMMGEVEGDLLARGMGGASIEAVNKAMIGRQLQQSLDQSTMQQQISSAQQLRQGMLDRAGLKLNANQLLLQQILGSAEPLATMGLQERMVQTNRTTTTKQSGTNWAQLAEMGGRLGAAALTGGISEVAAGAAGATKAAQGATRGAGAGTYGGAYKPPYQSVQPW